MARNRLSTAGDTETVRRISKPVQQSLQVRLRRMRVSDIKWPEDVTNRYRSAKGQPVESTLNRLLLVLLPVVLEMGDGTYVALNDIRALLAAADDGESMERRLIRCLVIRDADWSVNTWSTAICWLGPWLNGYLTGRWKRRIHQVLRRYPVLAAVVDSRPPKRRAKDVIQVHAGAPNHEDEVSRNGQVSPGARGAPAKNRSMAVQASIPAGAQSGKVSLDESDRDGSPR